MRGRTPGARLGGGNQPAGHCRELREETGIRAGEEEFLLLESARGGESFFDFYFLIHPVPRSEIVLQPGETSDARWVTLDELPGDDSRRSGASPSPGASAAQEARLERLVWKRAGESSGRP